MGIWESTTWPGSYRGSSSTPIPPEADLRSWGRQERTGDTPDPGPPQEDTSLCHSREGGNPVSQVVSCRGLIHQAFGASPQPTARMRICGLLRAGSDVGSPSIPARFARPGELDVSYLLIGIRRAVQPAQTHAIYLAITIGRQRGGSDWHQRLAGSG